MITRPDFIIGNEQRFFDFVKNLSGDDRIALISHTDLDGIASAKVANEVIQANMIRFVGYTELNDELIRDLKKSKINKIIFTDLFIESGEFIKILERFAEILIIDHHRAKEDFNSDKTVFMNAQEFCATYICYYLFGRLQNIDKYDWLVACASLADGFWYKNREWMDFVYRNHGERFVAEASRVMRGRFWDAQILLSSSIVYFEKNLQDFYEIIPRRFWDFDKLKIYANRVQMEVNEFIARFEKEKEQIKGGFFFEFNPNYRIGSIVATALSLKYPTQTLILGRLEGEYYNISARRSDGKEDMGILLKKLISGIPGAAAGGHIPAAGGHILFKDKEIFKRRMKNI